MANEWVPVELYGTNNDGEKRRYTIADGTSVSKGTLLALSDPRTVTAAVFNSTAFAGVAAEEHAPGEGTSISVWTNGIFEALCSGAIGCGSPITGASANAVVVADYLISSGAAVLGYALEAGTAQTETINVRLML
jgi:hypothetical protein